MVARRSVLGSARATVWTRRKFGSVYVSLGRMLGFSFGIGVTLQVTDLLRRPQVGRPEIECKPYATRPTWRRRFRPRALCQREVTSAVRNGRACGDSSLFGCARARRSPRDSAHSRQILILLK